MTARPAGLSIEEQETVICIERSTGIAHIYTSDTRMVTKLDKKYERTNEYRNQDGITAVEYEVPESFIQFATKRRTMTLSDAQRDELRKRMQDVHSKRNS
mgnify:CR=1 FL=1